MKAAALKNRRRLGLFFGAGLLCGCVFSDDAPAPADIAPLAVGNTWVYVDSAYYGNDSITVSTSETSILGKRAVVLEGKTDTVFLSNNHAVGGAPGAISTYVRNFGHSNYNCGAEWIQAAGDTARVTGTVLHLEYPTTDGRRYKTHFFGFRTEGTQTLATVDTLEIEVVSARHTCTVPAGRFPCVQYRGYRPDGSLFATAYHAPGVGYLGYEILDTLLVGNALREVRYTKRLTSFTLH